MRDNERDVLLSLMLGLFESETIEQFDINKDEEVEDNDEEENEHCRRRQQRSPLLLLLRGSPCLSFLYYFKKSLLFPRFDFFFFLVSFFGFGYLIFEFDFLGCGLMTDVLGFNLIQWV